jgi:hypothetical protein
VRVVVTGKRQLHAPPLCSRSGHTAGDLPELIVRATADKSLWRGKKKPATRRNSARPRRLSSPMTWHSSAPAARRAITHSPRAGARRRPQTTGRRSASTSPRRRSAGCRSRPSGSRTGSSRRMASSSARPRRRAGWSAARVGKGEYGPGGCGGEFAGRPVSAGRWCRHRRRRTYTVTRTVDGILGDVGRERCHGQGRRSGDPSARRACFSQLHAQTPHFSAEGRRC